MNILLEESKESNIFWTSTFKQCLLNKYDLGFTTTELKDNYNLKKSLDFLGNLIVTPTETIFSVTYNSQKIKKNKKYNNKRNKKIKKKYMKILFN